MNMYFIHLNLFIFLMKIKYINIKIQHLSQNFKEILNLLFKILKY